MVAFDAGVRERVKMLRQRGRELATEGSVVGAKSSPIRVLIVGVLPGDTISLAFGINNRGQVVGQSIGASGSRAFLWQDGLTTDLNTRTPSGSPFLIYANDINDRGEIVGQGCDKCAGETFAVKLIPRDDDDDNDR